MTREEAIKVLENPDVSIGVSARIGQDPEYWRKLRPALDMAISALRQQEHFRDLTKKVEPLTNAQKIRAMSDEELAKMLWKAGRNYRSICADPVVDYSEHYNHLIEWLQQPAEDDDHSICGATNLPCIRCNPGGCDNRKEGAD